MKTPSPPPNSQPAENGNTPLPEPPIGGKIFRWAVIALFLMVVIGVMVLLARSLETKHSAEGPDQLLPPAPPVRQTSPE